MHLQKDEIQVVSDSINMLASVMTKINYSPFEARDGLVIGSTVTFPTLAMPLYIQSKQTKILLVKCTFIFNARMLSPIPALASIVGQHEMYIVT